MVPVTLLWYEMRDQYADWKIRKMAREREAERRKARFFDRRSSATLTFSVGKAMRGKRAEHP